MKAIEMNKKTDWSETLLSLGLNEREKEEVCNYKKSLLQEKKFFEKY